MKRYSIQFIESVTDGNNYRITDNTTDSRIGTCYDKDNAELICNALNGEPKPLYFYIDKGIFFLQGRQDGADSLHLCFKKENIIISKIPIHANEYNTKLFEIETLFEGILSALKDELVDVLLTQSDTSYNPSRPFRWYKYATSDCADTDNPDDIKRVRTKALTNVLNKIGDADDFITNKFYIYKVTNL